MASPLQQVLDQAPADTTACEAEAALLACNQDVLAALSKLWHVAAPPAQTLSMIPINTASDADLPSSERWAEMRKICDEHYAAMNAVVQGAVPEK